MTRVLSCPSCGCPVPALPAPPKRNPFATVAGSAIAALLVALLIGGLLWAVITVWGTL